MAKHSIARYTFNAAAKTITFTDFAAIVLDRIYMVIDVTNNTIIYNPLYSTKGGTVATNVLTLTFDTSVGGYANGDALLIIYDNEAQGTLQNAVSATGNGTVLNTAGMASVVFTVSGTFVATVDFEGTEDGTNWSSLSTSKLGAGIVGVNTTAVGTYRASCNSLAQVRARVTWTSGTSVTVTAHASQFPQPATDDTLGLTTGAAVITDAVGTIQQYLRGLVKLLANVLFDATNQLRVSLYGKSSAAGDTPILVGADGAVKVVDANVVTANFSRPNDTTTYAAGDTVSDSTSAPTAFTASGFARNSGGSGRITSLTVIDEAAPALKANLELWIFSAAYTNNNDNTAWNPSLANARNLIAIVPLGGNPTVGGATAVSIYNAQGLDIPYVCAATALWWALVVRNAYIPVAVERFNFAFGVERYG